MIAEKIHFPASHGQAGTMVERLVTREDEVQARDVPKDAQIHAQLGFASDPLPEGSSDLVVLAKAAVPDPRPLHWFHYVEGARTRAQAVVASAVLGLSMYLSSIAQKDDDVSTPRRAAQVSTLLSNSKMGLTSQSGVRSSPVIIRGSAPTYIPPGSADHTTPKVSDSTVSPPAYPAGPPRGTLAISEISLRDLGLQQSSTDDSNIYQIAVIIATAVFLGLVCWQCFGCSCITDGCMCFKCQWPRSCWRFWRDPRRCVLDCCGGNQAAGQPPGAAAARANVGPATQANVAAPPSDPPTDPLIAAPIPPAALIVPPIAPPIPAGPATARAVGLAPPVAVAAGEIVAASADPGTRTRGGTARRLRVAAPAIAPVSTASATKKAAEASFAVETGGGQTVSADPVPATFSDTTSGDVSGKYKYIHAIQELHFLN
jgi:hypothetical protein